MKDIALELNAIDKSFFGVPAVQSVNFTLKQGHILGLVGENGAGKSTLMNIIGGVLQPDAGSMALFEQPYKPEAPRKAVDAGIAFIHQELNLFPNLSIAENIFLGNFPTAGKLPVIHKRTIWDHTRRLLESIELDVHPDTLVEKLSPGEKQLIEIIKALNAEPRILIFDEPTTSLTARETQRLFELIQHLRSEGRSIIYISHILEDVLQLHDEIVVLRDGQVTGIGTKNEFTINRLISLMVGHDIKQLYPERKGQASDEKVLEVKGVSLSGIVYDINFTLNKREILGIFGLMGSGRTELARILFGLDSFEEGEILIDNIPMKTTSPPKSIRHNVAFITENRREEGLLMNTSITRNIGLVSLSRFANSFLKIIKWSQLSESVKTVVNTLRIKTDSLERSTPKSLSGGNQQKVVIGKWLMSKPSVFIADEPTRGVDIGAKTEVYTILHKLATDGAGIIFISSEIEELIGVCDRILIMNRGEIVGNFAKHEFAQEKLLGAAFRAESN